MAKILAVDDEPKITKLLEAILTPQGYEVITAANGLEALEKVDADGIDLVLLDVMMPGMDGFEVLKILRAKEEKKTLPVILLTALSETEDRVKGMEAGCSDFITKPFERSDVIARVKEALKGRKCF